jgi:hypothetical protein
MKVCKYFSFNTGTVSSASESFFFYLFPKFEVTKLDKQQVYNVILLGDGEWTAIVFQEWVELRKIS